MTYVTYLQPWDYAAASILGESLGYRVVTLSGEAPDFQTRQLVMMVPLEMLEEIQSYIYERKELKCNFQKDLLKNMKRY